MTLLTTINRCQDWLSLPRSAVVATSTDDNVRTLLSLAQEEGKELARRCEWQAITKEKTFTSIAAVSQTGAIPTDFDRIVNESMFNRTRKRRVVGPLTSQEWQAQLGVVASVLTDAFRIRGDAILLTPTPPAGDTYAYEYVSLNWCQTSGGTGQTAWAADTDTGILSEDLMGLGIRWRFKKSRGLDYAEDFRTYQMEVNQAIARDGGKRTIDMSGDADRLFDTARYPATPDGNWSLP
jgi:hypothetical protein